MNPAGATRFARTTNRTWNDRGGLGVNGDYVPQCDLMNPAANGECGPWQQPAFGQACRRRRSIPRFSRAGAFVRRTGSSASSVQHEIAAANVGGSRLLPPLVPGLPRDRQPRVDSGRLRAVHVHCAAHPPCRAAAVTAVTSFNPRTNFSAATNYTTFASDYGDQYQDWHGVDVNVNARLRTDCRPGRHEHRARRPGQLRHHRQGAGVTAHRRARRLAAAASCHVTEPWLTQIRGLATYVVPKVDVQLAASFQFKPGTLGLGGNDSASQRDVR